MNKNLITPKLAKALTVAIVRRASKHYPGAGVVGVYSFEGVNYSRKAALREAVGSWCEKLTYNDVPRVRANFSLL